MSGASSRWSATLFALLLGVVVGCASTDKTADVAQTRSMDFAEASEVLREYSAEHGMPAPAQAAPTSLAEVVDLLLADQTSRFDAAIRFLEGKQGGEVLTLRGLLELSYSDGFETVSDVLAELNRRRSLEVRRLRDKQASGQDLSDAEAESLDRLEADIERADRARVACEVLAEQHLQAASSLVTEAVKQSKPGAPEALTALAFYHLLDGDWLRYDEVMESVRGQQTETPMLHYLNALEALRRFTLRKEAREELRSALSLQPKFVRAQAKLVLLQDDIAATYAAFQELRKVSPGHAIVHLVGRVVAEEYENASAMQQARAQ